MHVETRSLCLFELLLGPPVLRYRRVEDFRFLLTAADRDLFDEGLQLFWELVFAPSQRGNQLFHMSVSFLLFLVVHGTI